MKTYLNELHKQYKDNHINNNTSNLSSTNKKDQDLTNINNNIPQNKLTKTKSGLFLNNFFRTNNSNGKIYNSLKKSSNTINTIKNFKKKKKINITPYQGIKNEYILNIAMDNLNKYQEDLLLKETNENWNNEKLKNIKTDLEKEIFNENNNNDFGYYSMNNKNNNIILNRKKELNQLMNKTQENFHPNNNFYKYENNKYSNENNKLNINNTNNNYYNGFYIKDDIFNQNIRNNNNHYDNISNREPCLTTKRISKYNSSNNFNSSFNKNNNNNNLNNINYERNYENKFNLFISKNYKNENSKQNTNSNNNQNTIDKKLIYILNNLELQELFETFKQNYIFFDDLFLLSREDLVEMKIPIGPRNRIINFIEKYKNYGKTYDFDELTLFMDKYKNILLNSNSNTYNNTFNINITPSTNNKHKSTTSSENNNNKKSFNSQGYDLPGKGLNMSNFDDIETLSKRNEEIKTNKYINSKARNKTKNNSNNYKYNNNDKMNNRVNGLNKMINTTKINNNEELLNSPIDDKIITNKINEINNKSNTSRINNFINLNNIDNSNDNSANIFSNSLFNEYGTNINNINEINSKNLDTTNKNKKNINIQNNNNENNSFKSDNMNRFLSTNSSKFKEASPFNKNNINDINTNKYDSPSLNFMNNKISYKPINPYKNFQNIFSEIESYQINYEKMKKENDDRNNKINNLLEKKNRPNIQYLKMKINNCKYFNDEDLKNESARDLKNELQKMNFQKDNDNNDLNSIKYNPSIQNYMKIRDKSKNKNPLIEEFNKNKSN